MSGGANNFSSGDGGIFSWHGRYEPTDILVALARDPDLRDHLTGRGYQRTRQFGWANTVKQMPEVQKSELMTFVSTIRGSEWLWVLDHGIRE